MYEKHIELIKREITQLTVSLHRAKAKKGARPEEVQNLENKRRLKSDILLVLEHRRGNHQYAVFWKMPPCEYNQNPDWVQFGPWHKTIESAEAELERVKENPRCAAVRIVAHTEIYEVCGGQND